MKDVARFEVGKVYIGECYHYFTGRLLEKQYYLCTAIHILAIHSRGEYNRKYVSLRRVYTYPNGLKNREKVYHPNYTINGSGEVVHIPHESNVYAEKVYEGDWYEGEEKW